MADTKWSAFTSGGAMTTAATAVGFAGGVNYKYSLSSTPSASAIACWDASSNLSANSFLSGYATTATAGATTTLTVASKYQQFFTGVTTQTVLMPVTSTLGLGQSFYIVNNSTGVVTVQSSGANTIQAMAAGSVLLVTCIAITGTTAASWNAQYSVDVDLSGAVLLSPTGDQTITSHNLIVAAGTVYAGLSTGGVAGAFIAYSATSGKGYFGIIPVANSNDYGVSLSNASFGQTSTISIPDPGGATADFCLAPSALVSGNLVKASGTAGLLVDAGYPAASLVAWKAASSTPITATINTGYYITDASQVTITLPATAAAGSVVAIVGNGAGGWVVQPGAAQTIKVLNGSTTVSVTSAEQYDCMELLCVVANSVWVAKSVVSTGLSLA